MIEQHPITAEAKRTAIPALAASCASFLSVIALQFARPMLGDSDTILVFVGLAFLAVGIAVLVPPTIPLFAALMFLESPLPLFLDNKPSALVTGTLLGLAAFGCLFSSRSRPNTVSIVVRRSVWFLGGCAIISAVRGLWLGNSTDFVVGDLFQIEEFVIVFILVDRLITDEKSAVRLLKCALAATYLNCVWQLVLLATGLSIGEGLPSVDDEVGGFLSRTINLDAIYLFVILLSIYPVIAPSRQRYWIWLLLGPTVANIVFSFTRGVWLAAVIGSITCMCLLTKEQRVHMFRAAALIFLAIALIGSVSQVGTGGSRASLLDTIEGRLSFGMTQVQEGWQGDVHIQTRRFVEIAMIGPQLMSSPFLGAGLGGLYSIDSGAMLAASAGLIDYHYMHNLYLRVAFRMGILGLAAFCFVLYSYFRYSLRHYFTLPRGPWRAVTAGLIAAVAAQVVLSMTSPTFLEHPMGGLAGCTMALTFRSYYPNTIARKPQLT